MPLVSVLMAVFNCEKYLPEAIESILNQTFSNFEFIIIDDCSKDRSFEIMNEFACHDDRIIVYRNEKNLGLAPTLNKGLKYCQCELVARADGDDTYRKDRLELQYNYMQQHPEIGVLSTGFSFMDETGKYISSHSVPDNPDIVKFEFAFGNWFVHSSVMYRKSIIINAGGYSEDMARGPEDYELWSRILKNVHFNNINKNLIKVRKRSYSNMSKENGNEIREAMFDISGKIIKQKYGIALNLPALESLYGFWNGYNRIDQSCFNIILNLILEIENNAKFNSSLYQYFIKKVERNFLIQSKFYSYVNFTKSYQSFKKAIKYFHINNAISYLLQLLRFINAFIKKYGK